MKRIYKSLNSAIAVLLLLTTSNSCSLKQTEHIDGDAILINQVGYPVNGNKIALVKSNTSEFAIKEAGGKTVFIGQVGNWKSWDLSGDSVKVADFSTVTEPGDYYLVIDDTVRSNIIHITQNPYEQLSKSALKTFYYNRSVIDIEEQYGKEWSRLGGHPDTVVYIHSSAASKVRPEGTIISSPGGWYDAGDYNKYIVNSAITTYTLMLSYWINSGYHQKMNINIPESQSDLADILAETLCNLKWMLTMQDPSDGGVYHKLTTKSFDGFIMPHEATAKRYVVEKSTTAALDFAASMAYAYRIFSKEESSKGIAEEFLKASMLAYQWAINHPEVYFTNPPDISTGEYGDTTIDDEWFWAASELYLATAEEKYLETIKEKYQKPNTPKWNVVNTLGIVSLLTSDVAANFENYQSDYMQFVNRLVEIEKKSSYRVSVREMAWGSNSDVANQGVLKAVAYFLTQDEKFQNSAQSDLDYLLGRNATGYCFVTGFGYRSPMNIHHRPSAADGIEKPVPGFLVGGPNTVVLTDCGDEVKRSTYPAVSYIDAECSYSTNEIAINWNAPLVLLTSSINADVN